MRQLSTPSLHILRGLAIAAWESARELTEHPEEHPKYAPLHHAYLEVDGLLNERLVHERWLECGAYVELETVYRVKRVEILGTLQVVSCINCTRGWSVGKYEELPLQARNAVATWCPHCGDGVDYRDRDRVVLGEYHLCCCGDCFEDGEMRYSLGLPTAYYCEKHYNSCYPYRKEGREGFSEQDAGERYEND